MLLRVMGEETAAFFEVVTVYKTSKIKKYWMVMLDASENVAEPLGISYELKEMAKAV